jgi:hypothetical protein
VNGQKKVSGNELGEAFDSDDSAYLLCVSRGIDE